jgi:hypothetical protein
VPSTFQIYDIDKCVLIPGKRDPNKRRRYDSTKVQVVELMGLLALSACEEFLTGAWMGNLVTIALMKTP